MDYDLITTTCQLKNISLAELAKLIGASRSGIYMSMREKTMRIETLEKIAEVLEVPITVFFGYDERYSAKESLERINYLRKMLKESSDSITKLKNKINSIWEAYLYFIGNLPDEQLRAFYQNAHSKKLQNTMNEIADGDLFKEIDKQLFKILDIIMYPEETRKK
jgi:transcriptional regulator with XRE-family HTH domain